MDKNEQRKRHQKQVELAEILFESGMELPVIEKITGIDSIELLADQIALDEDNNSTR